MTDPLFKAFEWNIDEFSDPSGQRHIENATFAFKQILASGCSGSVLLDGSTSGTLTFDGVTFENNNGFPSEVVSKTSVFNINNVVSGLVINNMKVYNNINTVNQFSNGEPVLLQYVTSGVWLPGLTMGSGSFSLMPTSVPDNQNLFRQDGNASLVAVNDDNVSQYIYMSLVVPFGHSLGLFGVCGSGLLQVSVIFDYF